MVHGAGGSPDGGCGAWLTGDTDAVELPSCRAWGEAALLGTSWALGLSDAEGRTLAGHSRRSQMDVEQSGLPGGGDGRLLTNSCQTS